LPVGSWTLIRFNQCEQCRRPMVLFGLERDQLRFVCGVCAAMRAGLPDPGRPSVWIATLGRKPAVETYLEQIPLPPYGKGEQSRRVWV